MFSGVKAARPDAIIRHVFWALRQWFGAGPRQRGQPTLPTFSSGGELVDISNRDALYDVMDGRE
jgi:hypothetical protein